LIIVDLCLAVSERMAVHQGSCVSQQTLFLLIRIQFLVLMSGHWLHDLFCTHIGHVV